MKYAAIFKVCMVVFVSSSLLACRAPSITVSAPSTFSQSAIIDTPQQEAAQVNTKVPMLSPTEVPVAPTLTLEEREQVVRNLLLSKDKCSLPCWWGVLPGKTLWDQAKPGLEKNGLILSSFHLPLDTRIGYGAGLNNVFGEGVHLNLNYLVENNLIDAITLEAYGNDLPKLYDIFQAYSPEEVIKEYGKPSRVWIDSVYQGTSSVRDYGIWLFYDDLGVLLKYGGTTSFRPMYEICPGFDENSGIEKISIYIKSKGSPIPLENYGGYLSDAKAYFHPIQDFGMAVDDFDKLVLNDSPQCFEIDSTKFP